MLLTLAENRGNAGKRAQPLLQRVRLTAKSLLRTSGHQAALSPKELTRYFCSRQTAPVIATGTPHLAPHPTSAQMRPEVLSLGDQSRNDTLLPSSSWMSLQDHPGTDPGEAPLDCEMQLEKPSQKAQTRHAGVGESALTRASRAGTPGARGDSGCCRPGARARPLVPMGFRCLLPCPWTRDPQQCGLCKEQLMPTRVYLRAPQH